MEGCRAKTTTAGQIIMPTFGFMGYNYLLLWVYATIWLPEIIYAKQFTTDSALVSTKVAEQFLEKLQSGMLC